MVNSRKTVVAPPIVSTTVSVVDAMGLRPPLPLPETVTEGWSDEAHHRTDVVAPIAYHSPPWITGTRGCESAGTVVTTPRRTVDESEQVQNENVQLFFAKKDLTGESGGGTSPPPPATAVGGGEGGAGGELKFRSAIVNTDAFQPNYMCTTTGTGTSTGTARLPISVVATDPFVRLTPPLSPVPSADGYGERGERLLGSMTGSRAENIARRSEGLLRRSPPSSSKAQRPLRRTSGGAMSPLPSGAIGTPHCNSSASSSTNALSSSLLPTTLYGGYDDGDEEEEEENPLIFDLPIVAHTPTADE